MIPTFRIAVSGWSKRAMAMSVVLRRVSSKPLSSFFLQKLANNSLLHRFMSGISDELPSYHGKISKQSDYIRWENGGGIYHSSAIIDRTALIETGAIVHSNCTIDQNVQVGSGTVVGPSTSIGESTKIGYNVVLSNCSVGQFCVIHHGVCIGQDGFGFFVDDKGKMVKKPQMLNVKIGDHVEIGANTCIDRGRFGALLERHGYRRLHQTG